MTQRKKVKTCLKFINNFAKNNSTNIRPSNITLELKKMGGGGKRVSIEQGGVSPSVRLKINIGNQPNFKDEQAKTRKKPKQMVILVM